MTDPAQSPAVAPNGAADEVLRNFGNRLVFYALNGYEPPTENTSHTRKAWLAQLVDHCLTETHGLPGALGFLYLNDILKQFPDDPTYRVRQFCVEWAAVAVMMHDLKGIYWGKGDTHDPQYPHLRLMFDVDPLSCVITLADILEDFCRPSAKFSKFSEQQNELPKVKLEYPADGDATQIECAGSKHTITYQCKTAPAAAKKRSFLPKEKFEVFDNLRGYIDLSVLGIDSVEMLAEGPRLNKVSTVRHSDMNPSPKTAEGENPVHIIKMVETRADNRGVLH
jgi:hypothetical protein